MFYNFLLWQDYYEASRYSMRLDLEPCKKKAGYCPSPR